MRLNLMECPKCHAIETVEQVSPGKFVCRDYTFADGQMTKGCGHEWRRVMTRQGYE